MEEGCLPLFVFSFLIEEGCLFITITMPMKSLILRTCLNEFCFVPLHSAQSNVHKKQSWKGNTYNRWPIIECSRWHFNELPGSQPQKYIQLINRPFTLSRYRHSFGSLKLLISFDLFLISPVSEVFHFSEIMTSKASREEQNWRIRILTLLMLRRITIKFWRKEMRKLRSLGRAQVSGRELFRKLPSPEEELQVCSSGKGLSKILDYGLR